MGFRNNPRNWERAEQLEEWIAGVVRGVAKGSKPGTLTRRVQSEEHQHVSLLLIIHAFS
jgi:hypothetical protein